MSAKNGPNGHYTLLHLSITLGIVCLKLVHSDPMPEAVRKSGQYTLQNEDVGSQMDLRDTLILKEITRYSQQQNLLQSANTDAASYASLADFSSQNAQEIDDAVIQNEELCTSLQLESPQCYQDCIYYLSPLTLLSNTSDGDFGKVLSWYQMVISLYFTCMNTIHTHTQIDYTQGGSPIGWYDNGNPDMCNYMDGTYCSTPILFEVAPGMSMNIQEHGLRTMIIFFFFTLQAANVLV